MHTAMLLETAQTFRAQAEVTFKSSCPTLVNDKELSVSVLKYVRELLGSKKAFCVEDFKAMNEGQKSAGFEDFAYISQKISPIMLAMAAGQPENEDIYPHQPYGETNGSAVYAYTTLR